MHVCPCARTVRLEVRVRAQHETAAVQARLAAAESTCHALAQQLLAATTRADSAQAALDAARQR
jgi:hypothetical protein